MLSAFLLSFGVIFVAELGDKSQLMAMAFAARYKPWPVLLGITIATAVTHAISVGIGAVVGARIPTDTVAIIAGIAFLVFAGWTLRGDSLDDDEVDRADSGTRNAVVAASGRSRRRRSAWILWVFPLARRRRWTTRFFPVTSSRTRSRRKRRKWKLPWMRQVSVRLSARSC